MKFPLRMLAIVCALALVARSALAHPGVHDGITAVQTDLQARPTAENYLALAELLRLAGDFQGASLNLDRAEKADAPATALALCRAALALDQGRLADALSALGPQLAREPGDARALLLRARIRMAEGNSLAAARDLGLAIERLRSPSPDAVVERASLLLAAGPEHAAEAMATLTAGIARLGSIPSLELAAVDLEEARGDLGAALARLDRMAERLERPGAWLARRAELLARRGDAEGAVWAAAAASAAGLDRSVMRTAAGAPAGASSSTESPAGASPAIESPAIAPAASIAAVLTRGPYLADGTSSRITIRWRTDVATDGRVRYGTSLANLNLTVYDAIATTEHILALPSLAADTRYYYSVGTGTQVLAGGNDQHTFVTAPTPGVAKATRLWVIGDSGTGAAGAASVRDAFAAYSASRPADLWLMLGDNAYASGTDAEYQAGVFNMYPALLRSTVLWPTRGNHDILYSGANNDYYDIFTLPSAAEGGGLPSGTEAYYAFDYGNIHFVCLDSEGSSRAVGGPMAVWLRADLAATPRDWVIAFWHHPPYSKGSHDSDNDLDSGARMGEMRRNIVPILDSAGVDLVLAGHSHSYERSFLINGHYGVSSTLTSAMIVDGDDGRWNGDGAYAKPTLGTGPREGCVYTVNGVGSQVGGGSLDHPVMVTSLNLIGSMVIDVSGNRLDARFVDAQHAVLDSFTIVKAVPVSVPGEPKPGAPGLRILGSHPTRGAVRFAYRLDRAARARVVMLDAVGRRVRAMPAREEAAGDHQMTWDGRDDDGRPCAAGIYFAVLEAGERTWARKVVRLGP